MPTSHDEHRTALPEEPCCAWSLPFFAVGLSELALRAWFELAPGHGRLDALIVWQCLVFGSLALLLWPLAAPCARRLRATRSALALALALGALAGSTLALELQGSPTRTLLVALAAGALGSALLATLLSRLPANLVQRGPALAALLALLSLLAAGVRGRPHVDAPPAAEGPSLLLVTIDTLRADHVGAYGHAAARTPVLDALAAQGVLFEHAVTPTIWTGPSHASILTGRLPAEHGLHANLETLRPNLPTLADALGQSDHATWAVVASAPVSEHGSRLPGRFDWFDDDLRAPYWPPPELLRTSIGRLGARFAGRAAIPLRALWRPAERVTDRALAWLRGDDPRPYFGWVHYFDPHLPYRAPDGDLSPAARDWDGPALDDWGPLAADLRQRVRDEPAWLAHMAALYDAEVAHVDRELGRLLEGARARAGQAGLWIVVTSDHGESFGEHDLWFERDLFEPSLRVPLIIVPPKGHALTARAGTRVPGLVQTIDLAPTVLELCGAAEAFASDGRSLVPALEDARSVPARPAVSSILNLRGDPSWNSALGVRTDRWKSIWRVPSLTDLELESNASAQELYDLERDPAELEDLALEQPDVHAELWPLAEALARPRVIEQRAMGEAELEALRGLGYTR